MSSISTPPNRITFDDWWNKQNYGLPFFYACREAWQTALAEGKRRAEAKEDPLGDFLRAEASSAPSETQPLVEGDLATQRSICDRCVPAAIEPPHPRTFDLMDYIDALFVSGNEVPVTSTLLSKASWDIICEMCEEGLALDYHVVEAEAVYRRKLAAYGDETRATSPLKAWKEKHLGI